MQDVVKTRFQLLSTKSSGIASTLKEIVASEGVGALCACISRYNYHEALFDIKLCTIWCRGVLRTGRPRNSAASHGGAGEAGHQIHSKLQSAFESAKVRCRAIRVVRMAMV